MNRKQLKKMILDVLARADYDLYKSFKKETAEEWEYSKQQLEELLDIAEKHVKKAAKTTRELLDPTDRSAYKPGSLAKIREKAKKLRWP